MPRQEDAPGDTEGKGRTSDTAANAPLAEQTAGGQVAKSAEEPGNAPTISDVPDAPVEAEHAEAAKQQHASKPETKTTPVETATEESAPVAEKAGAKEAASEEPARRQAVEAEVAEMAEPAAKEPAAEAEVAEMAEPAAEAEVAEMAEPAAEADTGKAPKTASLDDADRPAAKRQSTAAAAKSAPKKPPGKKATKKAGGKKAAPKKSKKAATKKTSPKKKADTKETRPNTLEDELAETLTPEEIDSFQIEKVDMEKLTYKVCDPACPVRVRRHVSGGFVQKAQAERAQRGAPLAKTGTHGDCHARKTLGERALDVQAYTKKDPRKYDIP